MTLFTLALSLSLVGVSSSLAATSVVGTSSNPSFLPESNLLIEWNGSAYTITLALPPDQEGGSTLRFFVTDGVTAARLLPDFGPDSVHPPPPTNSAPSVSEIACQTVPAGASVVSVSVAVSDAESPISSLTVQVSADDALLFPAGSILVEGVEGNRTLTLRPTPGRSGTTTVTVNVSDGQMITTRAFLLTVGADPPPPPPPPPNTAPFISEIGHQTMLSSAGYASIPFSVSDAESPAESLTVQAYGDNPALISDANLFVDGLTSNRSLILRPPVGRTGTMNIALRVSDGQLSFVRSFILTLVPDVASQETAYVTDRVLGTLRNDYSGFVGMRIGVGTSPITVTALGRMFVAGNSDTHVIKLVDAANGTDVAGGSVSLTMSGGIAGQFKYATLSSPVVLAAGATYYLASEETAGGDFWHDYNTTVTTTSVATGLAAGYGSEDGVWTTVGNAGETYGPVDFKYSSGSPPPTNTLPFISPIPNQTIPGNADSISVSFTVVDVETPVDGLVLVAWSDDPAIIPSGNLSITGRGAGRTLTVFREPGASGETTVSVMVGDGVYSVVSAFDVTIVPEGSTPNTAPYVAPVSNQSVPAGAGTISVSLNVRDAESPANTLTVTAWADDASLIPDGNISIDGTGENRTLLIRPTPNQAGTTTLDLSVSDGQLSTTTSFVITVTPGAPVDGQLRIQSIQRTASPGMSLTWTTTPGETYQVMAKERMEQSFWMLISPKLVAYGPSLTWTDLTANGSSRFYQIRRLVTISPAPLPPRLVGLTPHPDGEMELRWTGQLGATYRVLAKEGLDQLEWIPISGHLVAEGSIMSWIDRDAWGFWNRFYTIELLP